MTHQLKPRPYSEADAKKLLAPVIDEQTADWHYAKHHKGYVDKRNEIEEALASVDRSKANANSSQFRALKAAETFNASGIILHEIYWENMGGEGKADTSLAVVKKIIKDFGSVEKWQEDFIATAMAARGWAVTCLDASDGKLHNFLVDFHHLGAVWGATPLIACDVWEHAYYHKDGPDRKKYVAAFVANLHWKRINERFSKAK